MKLSNNLLYRTLYPYPLRQREFYTKWGLFSFFFLSYFYIRFLIFFGFSIYGAIQLKENFEFSVMGEMVSNLSQSVWMMLVIFITYLMFRVKRYIESKGTYNDRIFLITCLILVGMSGQSLYFTEGIIYKKISKVYQAYFPIKKFQIVVDNNKEIVKSMSGSELVKKVVSKKAFPNIANLQISEQRKLKGIKVAPIYSLIRPKPVVVKKAVVIAKAKPVVVKEALVIEKVKPVVVKKAVVIVKAKPVVVKKAVVTEKAKPVVVKKAVVIAKAKPVAVKKAVVIAKPRPVVVKKAKANPVVIKKAVVVAKPKVVAVKEEIRKPAQVDTIKLKKSATWKNLASVYNLNGNCTKALRYITKSYSAFLASGSANVKMKSELSDLVGKYKCPN